MTCSFTRSGLISFMTIACGSLSPLYILEECLQPRPRLILPFLYSFPGGSFSLHHLPPSRPWSFVRSSFLYFIYFCYSPIFCKGWSSLLAHPYQQPLNYWPTSLIYWQRRITSSHFSYWLGRKGKKCIMTYIIYALSKD